MKVALSRIHFPVTTLGPGRRLGIWLQGCSIRCPGCISVDTWEANKGIIDLEDVLTEVARYAAEADGLTVSGGEPLDQPKALTTILSHWREQSSRPVLLFSGRNFEGIEPWLLDNPGLVDAVLSGPFRSDLPQTLALRGSDNQELHVLTSRGEDMLAFDRPADDSDRRLDIMFDEEGSAWMAGIPARGDVARLRRALQHAGHRSTTSDSHGAFAA